MSVSSNLAQIMEAVRSRKEYKRIVKKINDDNEKERDDETLINSVIYSIINIYGAVSSQAEKSNIALSGFVLDPAHVAQNKIGSVEDPRVIIESAKLNKDFNKIFEIHENVNEYGKEEYIVSLRKQKLMSDKGGNIF